MMMIIMVMTKRKNNDDDDERQKDHHDATVSKYRNSLNAPSLNRKHIHALYRMSKNPFARSTTTLLFGNEPATPYRAAELPMALPLAPLPST